MPEFILALYVFVVFGMTSKQVVDSLSDKTHKGVAIFLVFIPVMGLALLNMLEKVMLWTL